MSRPAWGHTSPALTTFLARPLIALAAIVGSAHDVFGADAEEDEAGESVVLVALCVLGFVLFLLTFGTWLVTGEVPEA